MEIFTFDKSLQERLVDYTGILSQSEVIPASRIKTEWSIYIELVIEPAGWRALWKIPRLTCQEFEIHYPMIVVVEVEQVDFGDLSALVKIIAVQDEIHLPERHDVPLDELYPLIEQENKVLDVCGTAACIDQLRFFFHHLWMPWDLDDDDSADWVKNHLETRLRFFFDLKRGVVDKETCDVARALVREGREIQARIRRLEADISDDEDGEDCRPEKFSNDVKACQLMKLHFRAQQIRTEMEVMENPAMRDMMRKVAGEKSAESRRRESRGRKREGYFVWHGGSPQDTINSLTKAKDLIGDDVFLKVTGCLREALDASEAGDAIAVGEGEHCIRGAGGLEEGGILRGIGNLDSIVIRPKETDSGPLLDFSGGEILLENITLDLGELQAGIIVRRGTVKLTGCKIFVTSKSVIKLGVIVLASGNLILENCIFSGLGTAVSIHPAGEATFYRCQFEDCVEGVQLHDEARLNAHKCAISGFREYGIRMETQKYLSGTDGKTGGAELLSSINEIQIIDCTFENNQKGDVALRPRLASALTNTKQDSSPVGIKIS